MENLIYILEDDQDIAHLLEIVLRKQNYQVEHFETGEDLLQALEKQVPQLMLLDIMLPGISGIDVLKKFVPIVTTTIYRLLWSPLKTY